MMARITVPFDAAQAVRKLRRSAKYVNLPITGGAAVWLSAMPKRG